MSHTVTLETYHVIGIPLVTSGLLTFNGAVISQTTNAVRNTLSLKLNSTQLTTPKEEWINKRKEAKNLIYIPDS